MSFFNMDIKLFDQLRCSYVNCVLQCLLHCVLYVASLYVWGCKLPSMDSLTIKKRFLSILFMLLFSLLYTWYSVRDETEISIWHWLGLKWDGIFISAMGSLILTCVLFLGPICIKVMDLKAIFGAENIKSRLTDIIWIKNTVVVPVSEEFTFRACNITLLLQYFDPLTTIFISPLFFGAAHCIQFIERIRDGASRSNALVMTAFQFVYTTIFGAYAAMLYISTGNIIAPIVAHSFCNLMGFPSFYKMIQVNEPRRTCLFVLTVMGFVLWLVGIIYVSDPWIFSNQMDWTEMNRCNGTELRK